LNQFAVSEDVLLLKGDAIEVGFIGEYGQFVDECKFFV
jgi:hypothetical protein